MPLEKNEAVITPSGRTAQILEGPDADGYLELRYIDEPMLTRASLTLLACLVRPIRRGRPLPEPVRLSYRAGVARIRGA